MFNKRAGMKSSSSFFYSKDSNKPKMADITRIGPIFRRYFLIKNIDIRNTVADLKSKFDSLPLSPNRSKPITIIAALKIRATEDTRRDCIMVLTTSWCLYFKYR